MKYFSTLRHDGLKPDRNDRNNRNDSERNDRNDRNDRNQKNGSANRRKYNNKESDNENYTWGKAKFIFFNNQMS